jgi:Protein of unknown function (DUF3572)
MKRSPSSEPDKAAELAIAALGFLAADEERFTRFLALTGLEPQSLRTAAREPGFLLGVIEHVVADEDLLVAFAEENGVDPEEVERARGALAGHPGDTAAA